MNGVFWSHGHLAWPFFLALVFTGVLILAADAIWRLVTLPAWQLFVVAVSVWALGLFAIYGFLP